MKITQFFLYNLSPESTMSCRYLRIGQILQETPHVENTPITFHDQGINKFVNITC